MNPPINFPTYLAEGTRLQGDFFFQSSCVIDALIEGNITQQTLESVRIGVNGWIHGSISSQGPITVEGRVDGNLFSSTEIKLKPTAKVRGTIIAPSIQILPGAIVEAQIHMQTKSVAQKKAA